MQSGDVRKISPKVHCLTNPVTMNDVANVLLAAGGSAIMAQAEEEAAEITAACQATLLNTGVPDEKKLRACILAGKKANELGHPVVLDPVGVGASVFRRKLVAELLAQVRPTVIRCNQGEAAVLLSAGKSARLCEGVESGIRVTGEEETELARKLARAYNCTVLVTGAADVVSDGKRYVSLSGGDARIRRVTGGGCMLSALCALFCCMAGSSGSENHKTADTADACTENDVQTQAGIKSSTPSVFDGVCLAGQLWKAVVAEAGRRTDKYGGGIGTFHAALFDTLERMTEIEK